jgi:hypothetical protein
LLQPETRRPIAEEVKTRNKRCSGTNQVV